VYFFLAKFFEATIVSHALIFGGVRHHLALQLFLGAGMIGCAIVAAVHDYKLCSLRKSGDTGYQIPKGLLFRWVSGPNYLFELLEWVFFIWFLPMSLVLVAFGLLVMANVTGRAESNHDAYVKRLFKNKYPDDRCPYIPFVMKSRYLI
jgi:steroid 5-alpha reductase family enzyme